MPLILSHYLLAGRMREHINQNHPQLKVDVSAFLWGAQGDDFLRFTINNEKDNSGGALSAAGNSSVLSKGAKIIFDHRREMLDYLLEFSASSKNDIDFSYALGFAVFLAFDEQCGPFVSFGAGQLSGLLEDFSENDCRNELESTLDTILLRYEKAETPFKFPLIKCAPNDNTVMQHIAVMYTYILMRHFSLDADMNSFLSCAEDYVKKLKKWNDPLGFKKQRIIKKEKNGSIPKNSHVMYRSVTEDDTYDYANILKKEWHDGEAARTDDFTALFEKAFESAKTLIDNSIRQSKIISAE